MSTYAEKALAYAEDAEQNLGWLPITERRIAWGTLAIAYASLALVEELAKFQAVAVEERDT